LQSGLQRSPQYRSARPLARFVVDHTQGGEVIIEEGAPYSSTFKIFFVQEGSVRQLRISYGYGSGPHR
jgi:hypothetical protein